MKKLIPKKHLKDLVELEMENEEYSGKIAIRTLKKALARKRIGKINKINGNLVRFSENRLK